MIFYVHRGSGQARVYRRRWLSLSSRAKAFILKGRHKRFVGDSAFDTSLRGAPLLVGEQQKWFQQILQKVQNLVPHDNIKSCTVDTVLEHYVCVCFLPIHSGHQVRWTYQPGSHRSKVTQDFSSTFFLRRVPLFFSREGFSHSFPSSTVKSNFVD